MRNGLIQPKKKKEKKRKKRNGLSLQVGIPKTHMDTPPNLARAAILTMVFSDNMQDLSRVEFLNCWSLPDQKNHHPPITSITIHLR